MYQSTKSIEEPKNIIFLDMDGVINCNNVIKEWINEKGNNKSSLKEFKEKYCLNPNSPLLYFIVPELLNRFNELYNQIPNCKVVWSSSWRLTTKKESKLFIESLYYQCGFVKGSFLSYTPDMRYRLRSDEIKDWIKTFRTSYNIRKCAIIDDLSEADLMIDSYLGIPIKFFKTEFEFGLTEEIANKIKNYFNE